MAETTTTTTLDIDERTTAGRLELDHPGWVVSWSLYWRHYWAVSGYTGDILWAYTAEALAMAMRAATPYAAVAR